MRALFPVFLFIWFNALGQEVEHRLILFGDAGEVNAGQRAAIQKAVELIIPEKSSVYFLGDNIYPYGMALDRSEIQESIDILESQYLPFTERNIPVTFVAGNHDWDKSRSMGLEKVKAQEEFIKGRGIKNLRFLPKAGSADVIAEDVTNSARILVYDSEYWLFPHHSNPDSALSSSIRQEFLQVIRQEVEQNKDKHVLILSHHPMRSYGEHGKNITWKDHIFPLTRINNNMYLPLPVLGSLYPLIRTTIFYSAEDATHPLYRELINDITRATKDFSNLIFVAGHDHGLQMIQDNNFIQIVTGSGAKRSHIAKHPTQQFVSNKQGFCVIDCLDNGQLLVSFYTVLNNQTTKSYEVNLPNLN
ncbi:calcineurin-like phosphoesterase family protein [Sphingobacterium alimentarium]|uniref:Calcineurin-like phosphoesterase family protein n=1 Tax=Sphingobacterium alimentarium TaxID=797292 RepID=A0A4R3W171_9SPHI|nr:metallophosphoesterase [Sphingobacterium alimentarium]TCV18643.1 calcineurin-like phosphoesterase family protein [Sphingobacterium alimentarium]